MQSAALTKQLVPRCRTLAVGPGASAGGRGRAGAAEAEAAGQHRPRTTAAQPETGRQERLQLSRAAAARQPVARRWTRPAVAGVAAAGAAVEHVAEDVAAGSLRPRRLRRPQRLSRPPAVQQPSLQQHRLVGMEGRGPQRSWCLGMRTGDRIVTAPLVSELSWAGLSSIELPGASTLTSMLDVLLPMAFEQQHLITPPPRLDPALQSLLGASSGLCVQCAIQSNLCTDA